VLGNGTRGKILAAFGGAALLGALAVGGVVWAQTPGSGASPQQAAPQQTQPGQRGAQAKARRDEVLNRLAQNLGIDRAKLDAALQQTGNQEIDAAVQSGKVTQDQANRAKQAIASGNAPFGISGFGGRMSGGGFGGGALMGCMQNVQAAISQALPNVSAADIRAALKAGKTFAQIAQDHGTTVQNVGTAVATAVQPCLDQAVKSGALTNDRETAILNGLRNGQLPGFTGRGRGPHPGQSSNQ
jgi:hypothetical protein